MSRVAMAPPTVRDVDLATVHAVLERARAQLSPDDHACVAGLVQTLIELLRLVRERGTTIARLRRLFGLHSSEKLADVLPHHGRAEPIPDRRLVEPDPSSAGVASPSDASDAQAAPRGEAPDPDRDADDDHAVRPRSPRRRRPSHRRVGCPTTSVRPLTIAATHPSARATAGSVRTRIPVRVTSTSSTIACTQGTPAPTARMARCIACPIRRASCASSARRRWPRQSGTAIGCAVAAAATCSPRALPPRPRVPSTTTPRSARWRCLRYGTGMPHHRLDRHQSQLQIPVPASTQWDVVRDRADALVPVFDKLCRQAGDGEVMHNDDTTMRILAVMGVRRRELLAAGALEDPERTGIFTTGIVSITAAGPIALFFTGRKHAGENLTALLKRRATPRSRRPSTCATASIATGRTATRSSRPTASRTGAATSSTRSPTSPPSASTCSRRSARSSSNDTTCRLQGLSDADRLAFHQRDSAPVMAELERWMKAELDEHRVEPNSGLGQAMQYLLKRWARLTLFLRVPGAPLDNNICERALKMAIRHRNNSLFYRTEYGAYVGDVYMTIISTTILHHENPFDYLVALLRHEAEVAADPGAWLPWTYRATLVRIQASTTMVPTAA